MSNLDELRSRVKQAFDEMRRYENALVRADSVTEANPDTAAVSALSEASERWARMQEQIAQLERECPDAPPDLRAEIERFYEATESLNEKEMLLTKGQLKEVERAAEERRKSVQWLIEATRQMDERKDEWRRHMTEFCEKWARGKGLSLMATLTDAQIAELTAAVDEEYGRWKAKPRP